MNDRRPMRWGRYELERELGGDLDFCLFRARMAASKARFLLKTPRHDRHREQAADRLRRELEVGRRLREAGCKGIAAAIATEEDGGRLALVFKARRSEPLDLLLSSRPPSPATALEIARRLTRALAGLHHQGFIHRFLRPSNILYDTRSGAVEITGLDSATEIPRQWQELGPSQLVKRSLAYMSPEQTGRTNRLVDYRTDFYSLGVTLFELLTGQLPFLAADPLELVQAQVAKAPPSPSEIDPGIPEMVSQIVLKLLAKAAEERYQGSHGLDEDLGRCLEELRAKGEVGRFLLGQNDVPARFELAQGLYGREAESERLVAALDSVARHGTEILLLAGYAGVGKTTLVGELRRQALARGALVVTGKHDELSRGVPYRGLREALRELACRLLGESRETLADHRQRLAAALGPNLGVIVDVVPELAPIAGEAPAVAALDSAEAKNRFHLSVERFLRVFARRDRPLVLFLDDLQWIDGSTLELLASCVPRGLGSCLLLGAYRTNEVDVHHPLTRTLRVLGGHRVRIETVELPPLERRQVTRLVAETLRMPPEKAAPLADLVFEKSGGNPFFAKAFLESLHDRGMLAFHPARGWSWDLGSVAALGAADTVVDLIPRKIARLRGATRRIVGLAAALERQVDPKLLSDCGGISESAVRSSLIEACREGIMLKRDRHYQFLHDRVRESAYALVPPGDRTGMHLSIGRRLSQLPEEADGEPLVFDAARHLNLARELLREPRELLEAARLNLEAGRQARVRAAFPAAYGYFSAGLELLPSQAWREHYDLALALHGEAADAACLSADFAAAERLAGLVHAHARDALDQIPAYETRAAAAHARQQGRKALELYLEALASLGIELPVAPDRRFVAAAAEAAYRAIDEVVSRPLEDPLPMGDPVYLAACRLLLRTVFAAAWTQKELVVLAECKLLELTLEHGFSPQSPFAFIGIGGQRVTVSFQLEVSYRAGVFGMSLLDRYGNPFTRPASELTFHSFLGSWKVPPSSLRLPFEESYRQALEAGTFQVAVEAAYRRSVLAFVSGERLDEVAEVIRHYRDELIGLGQHRMGRILDKLLALVGELLGPEAEAAQRHGPEVPADPAAPDPDYRLRTAAAEAMVRHLFRQSDAALELIHDVKLVPEVPALISFDLYRGLILADLHRGPRAAAPEGHLAKVERCYERLSRLAREAPEISRHRADLVAAEWLRARGEPLQAMKRYEQAIAGARRNGYLQEEGIAAELATELHVELGHSAIAAAYLKIAATAYARWGARAKLAQLEARYPDLMPAVPRSSPAPEREGLARVDALDMLSLESAARALAQNLDLASLLRELMRILLRDTGSERGFLLRAEDGEILLEASGSLEREEILLGDAVPLESRPDIAASIVRYVHRSHEMVCLGDSRRDGRFAADPYVVREKPRSVLCLPILRQGRPVAILYLENNHFPDAFNDDRLAAVELICSQAAVALENARLHADLRRVLRDLESKNAELEARNADLARLNFVLAHDLQNPLVTVRNYLGVLRRDLADGRRERLTGDLDRVDTAAAHLQRLLAELFELSRLDQQSAPHEEVALGDLVREALNGFAEAIAGRGVEVRVAPSLPMVVGDRARLLEAVRQLLGNALSFLGDQKAPRIEVGGREEREEVTVYVRDNGLGIDPRYQEKVFGLFERLDPVATEGSGVGLALVKRIVEIHGGRIWIESEGLGKGSTFYLTLPNAAPATTGSAASRAR